jgi:hypothetical protein
VTVMTVGRGDLAVWPPNLVRRGRGVAAPLIPRLGGRGLPRSVTGYAGGSAGSPPVPQCLPDEDGGDILSPHAVEVKMKAAR